MVERQLTRVVHVEQRQRRLLRGAKGCRCNALSRLDIEPPLRPVGFDVRDTLPWYVCYLLSGPSDSAISVSDIRVLITGTQRALDADALHARVLLRRPRAREAVAHRASASSLAIAALIVASRPASEAFSVAASSAAPSPGVAAPGGRRFVGVTTGAGAVGGDAAVPPPPSRAGGVGRGAKLSSNDGMSHSRRSATWRYCRPARPSAPGSRSCDTTEVIVSAGRVAAGHVWSSSGWMGTAAARSGGAGGSQPRWAAAAAVPPKPRNRSRLRRRRAGATRERRRRRRRRRPGRHRNGLGGGGSGSSSGSSSGAV